MKEEDEKEIDSFVPGITDFIQSIFEQSGGLEPMLWILVDTGTKYTVMSWPVPEMGVASDETKEILAIGMIKLLAHLRNVGIRPVCTLFTTEAWIRKIDVNTVADNKIPENWKDLPKTEGLMLNFETETKACTICFDIVQEGSKRKLVLSDLTKDSNMKKMADAIEPTRFSHLILRSLDYEI